MTQTTWKTSSSRSSDRTKPSKPFPRNSLPSISHLPLSNSSTTNLHTLRTSGSSSQRVYPEDELVLVDLDLSIEVNMKRRDQQGLFDKSNAQSTECPCLRKRQKFRLSCDPTLWRTTKQLLAQGCYASKSKGKSSHFAGGEGTHKVCQVQRMSAPA